MTRTDYIDNRCKGAAGDTPPEFTWKGRHTALAIGIVYLVYKYIEFGIRHE